MKVGELRASAQALGFTPQDQVRWLSPSQLLQTAGKVVVSGLFADYADRREVQAALPAALLRLDQPKDAGPAGLWIDVVADLGDGFDSTYSVAWLLAQSELVVDGHRLPRGDVLVLGGDEVYPTPSATGYEDRMTGPFAAALAVEDLPTDGGPDGGPDGGGAEDRLEDRLEDRRPVMLAVPGNHDWYDGLTAFLRIFAQRRRIGGWQTRQTRSYFAAELPGGWWLVGVDTQLGTYLDAPQLEYFRANLSARLAEGDSVIVCAPSPTWVRTGLGDPDSFNSLHYFEHEFVERWTDPETGATRPTGASVRAWISGDLHHYARYAESVPPDAVDGTARQLLTCGLGGAYLLGTADLPATIEVPPKASRMSRRAAPASFERRAAWPTAQQSKRLELGVLLPTSRGIIGRNPGLWRFVGLVHAFVLPVLAFLLGVERGISPGDALLLGSPGDVVGLAAQLGTWLGAAVLIACLAPVLRLDGPRLPPHWVYLAFGQLAVALAYLAVALAVPWPGGWNGWQVTGAAALGAFVVAGFAGCYTLALYILAAPDRQVREWAFSAQALEDGKGFLRLHLDADGRLTVYPILVEQVCHDWEFADDADPGAGRVHRRPVPVTGSSLRPRLIEEPVTVLPTIKP